MARIELSKNQVVWILWVVWMQYFGVGLWFNITHYEDTLLANTAMGFQVIGLCLGALFFLYKVNGRFGILGVSSGRRY